MINMCGEVELDIHFYNNNHLFCEGCSLVIKANAVLTGAVGFTSKRSLIVKFAGTGPVPGSGARAPESGAGRSQHRVLGGAAAENMKITGFIRCIFWLELSIVSPEYPANSGR